MTDERYNELMKGTSDPALTEAEIADGWHWCLEFDGLLVGPGMGELRCCSCWQKDHAVYKTVTKETQ